MMGPILMHGWLNMLGAATLHASVLVLVVLLVQVATGTRLAPRWRAALWWLVIARLLLPVVPGAPWSALNLLRGDSMPVLGVARSEAAAPTVATFLLLGLWALGMCGFGFVLARRALVTRRLLEDAKPIRDQSTLRLFDDCRRRAKVRAPVSLWCSPHVGSPLLVGLWRTRLILSPDAEIFGERVMRDVFLHELAHVRRRDLAMSWLVAIVLLIHWFNPLLWLAAWRIRADRECACDALALEALDQDERFDYGDSLLDVLSAAMIDRRPIVVVSGSMPGAAGVVESKSDLRRRLAFIAQHRRRGRFHGVIGAGCIIALAALLLPGAAPPTLLVTVSEVRPAAPPGGRYSFAPDLEPNDEFVARPIDPGVSTLTDLAPGAATAQYRPAGVLTRRKPASALAPVKDDR